MKTIVLLMLSISAFGSGNMSAKKPVAIKYSAAKNKIFTQRFYAEVYNNHNVEFIDSLVSPDYVEHQSDNHYGHNRKGLKKGLGDFFIAYPDAQVKVNFMLTQADMVIAQITITGTNDGEWHGLPATHKKINISGVDIIRYKDGKAVEHWGYVEEGKLLTQLGLIRDLMKPESSK